MFYNIILQYLYHWTFQLNRNSRIWNCFWVFGAVFCFFFRQVPKCSSWQTVGHRAARRQSVIHIAPWKTTVSKVPKRKWRSTAKQRRREKKTKWKEKVLQKKKKQKPSQEGIDDEIAKQKREQRKWNKQHEQNNEEDSRRLGRQGEWGVGLSSTRRVDATNLGYYAENN